MGKDNAPAASGMVELIRDLIADELAKQDTTAICKIVACNRNATYDIVVLPDNNTTISNIKSISPEQLNIGDYAYIYKFKNKLNNAIILTRIGGNAAQLRFVSNNDNED